MAGTELEATIQRWRRHALDCLLAAVAALGAIPLFSVFFVVPDALPRGFRLLSLFVYLLLVGMAAGRRLPHAVRAWVFILSGLALAVVMLVARGLQGHGRIMLGAQPLYATVLLGPRAGYAVGAAGLVAYGVVAALVARGALELVLPAAGASAVGHLWLLQGVLLVLFLGLALVLVNQFVVQLRAALAAEREAAHRVSEGDRERRRLERVLLETGERERRAVGHQLHDGPCQQMTAAMLRCEALKSALEARGATAEAEHVQAIARVLDDSVGEIHALAQGLSPPSLSPEAFAGALQDLVHQVRASSPVECELRHDDHAQPDDDATSAQLFRIAQEAVTNALRHARARHIGIELGSSGGTLQLVVRDDGIGMPAGRGAEGMGLTIMRHRAELIGGSISVTAAPGSGTVVVCAVPRAAGAGDAGGAA